MKSVYAIAVLSILGGLLVHLMVLLVIHIEGPVVRLPQEPPQEVKFIGSLSRDAMPSVIEQAALNDSAPLFMPTEWNLVSDMSNVASLQSATEIFEPFSPLLSLVDARPIAPMNAGRTDQSRDVWLPSGSAFFLSRYGRKAVEIPSITSEGVSFSVNQVDSSSRNSLNEQKFPLEVAASAPESLWNPVRLFLHLKGGVPIGLPLIAQGSGFVDWDASLQAYFTELAFYHQLNDGYYQIWVYP